MQTLTQVFILFLLLMTGYISKRLRVISNDLNHDLSNLILYVALPALVLSSLSNYAFSKQMMIKSGSLLMISLCVYALSIIISYITVKLFKMKGMTRDVLQYGIIFSNVGFMGYPMVNAIFGKEGIFYAAIYNLPFNVLTWTLGIMIMSRTHREKIKQREHSKGGPKLKGLLNPGIISVFIGFTMFLTSTKFPYPIFKALNIIGSTTTPLSMIFIGSILADMNVKKIFTNGSVFLCSIIRLIFLPMIVLCILKLFNFDQITKGIPVIITAMPVAANCAMFAAKYDSDYRLASQLIFISTLSSMLTIPFIVELL
ncbi:AEC family transporter [Crassaminicella thermophila]|uniref:AEC family transporter n=1 Tax=Crassaminicella thermophila TaxID=2599308 RepID=A0A5C0SDH7_CRATE|nr:AEC family transporter [Crassaminicella thermophila]QEK11294.1 AEC family transporter [Crassaminicella thermophila]